MRIETFFVCVTGINKLKKKKKKDVTFIKFILKKLI